MVRSPAPLCLLLGHTLLLTPLCTALRPDQTQAADPPKAGQQAGGQFKLPPVPDGTPAELLEYIGSIKQNNVQPSSRQQMMEYMKQVATATVAAAEKALVQIQPTDDAYEELATAKLESLMMLSRLGDQAAGAMLNQFAKSILANSNSPALAMEAKRLLLVAEAQELFAKRDIAAAAGLIGQTKELLETNPNDSATAGLAMQLASAFEHMPGGEAAAREAYETFGPIFAASTNESIRQMGASFAGTLRRLSLPGNPMEITGTLLNGQPFDQQTLTGKVVLVDFWATWCGPCVAEIPNVLEQYKKYHGRGFEVVGISLDQDRSALEKFVVDRKIPWPILFEPSEGTGWQHPLATYYGISGIPTVILIGKDGNVITLNARGERLGEELDKIFSGKAAAGS